MHINQGWLVEALDGHYGAKSMSRNGYSPKFVVLHGTAGGANAAEIDEFFTNGTDANGQPIQASSHVIIDQVGTTIQGVSFDLAAWGNGYITAGHAAYIPDDGSNPNWYTISIEHVKSADDNSSALTDAQYAVSLDVIRTICDAYGIPKKRGDASGGIIGHGNIDPVNRSRCPGNYPWDQLISDLNPPAAAASTAGYSLENSGMYTPGNGDNWFEKLPTGQWRCKQTGKIVQGAIQHFYSGLTIDGTSLPLLGLPETDEIHLTDHDGKPCIIQRYERGGLKYRGDGLKSQPGCKLVSLLMLSDSLMKY